MKKYSCSLCGKASNTTEGIQQHAEAKHDKPAEAIKSPIPEREEQSIGSMMREAEISLAMGDDVEDWLVDMIP